MTVPKCLQYQINLIGLKRVSEQSTFSPCLSTSPVNITLGLLSAACFPCRRDGLWATEGSFPRLLFLAGVSATSLDDKTDTMRKLKCSKHTGKKMNRAATVLISCTKSDLGSCSLDTFPLPRPFLVWEPLLDSGVDNIWDTSSDDCKRITYKSVYDSVHMLRSWLYIIMSTLYLYIGHFKINLLCGNLWTSSFG